MKDNKTQTYYMKSLQYYVGLKNSPNELAKLYREHLIHSIAAFKYISKLRMPSDEMLNTMKVNCARLTDKLKDSTFNFYI